MRIEVSSELRPEDVYFLQAMAQGVVNARKKYPGPNGRFVAFAAEFGEALHAVQKIMTGRGTVQELGMELRQAAGMALRFAVEGDPLEFPSETQSEFPCIVHPDPTMKPHQPFYIWHRWHTVFENLERVRVSESPTTWGEFSR